MILSVGPLYAQADPISGGAGWVGAGLLGLVVGWILLKGWPDSMRLVRELVTSFSVEMEKERLMWQMRMTALSEAHDKMNDRLCKEFRDDMDKERAACDRRLERVDQLGAKVEGLVTKVDSLARRVPP